MFPPALPGTVFSPESQKNAVEHQHGAGGSGGSLSFLRPLLFFHAVQETFRNFARSVPERQNRRLTGGTGAETELDTSASVPHPPFCAVRALQRASGADFPGESPAESRIRPVLPKSEAGQYPGRYACSRGLRIPAACISGKCHL